MGGWPEGDKKEILSRLRASDCCWCLGLDCSSCNSAWTLLTALDKGVIYSRNGDFCGWGSLFGCFFEGWFRGAPKLRGFESDTVSHFDKLITEQDQAASGRWVHQRPGGRAWESELFQVCYQCHRHSAHLYVTSWERERLGVKDASGKL